MLYGVANAPESKQDSLFYEISGVLLDLAAVVPVDEEAAHVYADIKHRLRASGRLFADNDLWIAAVAIANGYTLVSNDRAFRRIPGLKVEDWLA